MYKELLKKYPIITDQIELDELEVILREFERVIDEGIAGDVVEFGCFSGTTSLFLQRLLLAKKSDKKLFVYDSFDGLPEKTKEDQSPLGVDFKRGELKTSKAQFIENFRRANLPPPNITKGWFSEIDPERVPNQICFAFLDGDYYKSIRASLDLIKDKLAAGAIIIIDDYDNPRLPGAKKAVSDSYARSYRVTARASLGILAT